VLPPDEAPTYWQPVPANGFIRNIFNRANTQSVNDFSIGTQTVAPGCMIREHTHHRNEEVIYVIEGRGFARIDGVDHAIERGSAVFIGHDRKHHFVNPGPDPLTFVWFFMPGGLDGFFAEIGRPRKPGEPAPEPFDRPDNIAEIEARTVFGWTGQSFDKKQ
jgi:mannose-6-phosphate isomerase-like protein (cupin superfamily)